MKKCGSLSNKLLVFLHSKAFNIAYPIILILLLVIGICFSVLYVIIPKLDVQNGIRIVFSNYLSGLRNDDFKSAYIESVGGLIGTFWAILGALWTQHFFTSLGEREKLLNDLRVIYYDFKYAKKEISMFMSDLSEECKGKIDIDLFTRYVKLEEKHNSKLKQVSILRQGIQSYRILFTDEWIRIVSSLPRLFTEDEREILYYVYGQFNQINLTIDAYDKTDSDSNSTHLINIYRRIRNYMVIVGDWEANELLNTEITPDKAKKDYASAVNKLKKYINIDDNSK